MKRIAMGIASGAMALGATMATTAPAQAAPLVTGGLVNVTITDSLNDVVDVQDVNLGVALALAANVCDVNVNVLARQLRDGGAACENVTNGDTATITQS